LAARDFARKDARVKAGKLGSIGWCFGGRMSLLLAIAAPDLDACVMYYGQPVDDVLELKRIKASLLGVFGNKDTSIPPTQVEEFATDGDHGAVGVANFSAASDDPDVDPRRRTAAPSRGDLFQLQDLSRLGDDGREVDLVGSEAPRVAVRVRARPSRPLPLRAQ